MVRRPLPIVVLEHDSLSIAFYGLLQAQMPCRKVKEDCTHFMTIFRNFKKFTSGQ